MIDGCVREISNRSLGLCDAHYRTHRRRARGVVDKATEGQRKKSALRVAVEASDWDVILVEMKKSCTVSQTGCWIWGRHIDGYGYGTLRYAQGKTGSYTYQAHRLMVEAKHRAKLGKQPVHHTCATRACINPDHLMPVTQRENVAEMLTRNYLESRIADLESALRSVVPDHHLLAEIGLMAAE